MLPCIGDIITISTICIDYLFHKYSQLLCINHIFNSRLEVCQATFRTWCMTVTELNMKSQPTPTL